MRLLIVSNRLPVTLQRTPSLQDKRSIGGLVTGIASYIRKIENRETEFDDYLWFGWPGTDIKKGVRDRVTLELMQKNRYCPVFLNKKLIEEYYHRFCNKVIWPLFHCFPNYVSRSGDSWKYYEAANRLFYLAIKDQWRKGDVIWIHDYHLMLLPGMIRNDLPDAVVSFFLHIPFPGYNLFHQLPEHQRTAILNGLTGADLIGFHTFGYARAFADCIEKDLRTGCDRNFLEKAGRKVRMDVFPMGIDYDGIKSVAGSDECVGLKADIGTRTAGCRVLLSIDRLDYTKGILNRLIAYYNFLAAFPAWAGKVVLMLVVAPSRREIDSYLEMKRSIDEWVGKINGEYTTGSWIPVVYQYRQFDLTELCALYGTSDVALITPLCDGMNLIAKEYVASNDYEKGVLILSEMAGAIHELSDALSVNPFSVEEITGAIHLALTMGRSQRADRNRRMHQRIRSYDVLKWAEDIMKTTFSVRQFNYENTAIVLV